MALTSFIKLKGIGDRTWGFAFRRFVVGFAPLMGWNWYMFRFHRNTPRYGTMLQIPPGVLFCFGYDPTASLVCTRIDVNLP